MTDELLEELPTELFGCHLQIDKTSHSYCIWYLPIGDDIDKRPDDFFSEQLSFDLPTGLAKKWLYLKKEGYIK